MRRQRAFGLLSTSVGIMIGAAIGAVIAVNLMILSGIDSGYESSIADVFTYNRVAGLLVVVALVAGPVVGGLLAWRWAANR